MRRRRHHHDQPEERVEPIDEDEQEQIVFALQREADQHVANSRRFFSGACLLAASLEFVVAAVVKASIFGWLHTVASAVLHIMASHTMKSMSPMPTPDILIATAAIVPFVMLFTQQVSVDDELHWGLSFANLMTAACSIFFRWDALSVQSQIDDLGNKKYQYKSL